MLRVNDRPHLTILLALLAMPAGWAAAADSTPPVALVESTATGVLRRGEPHQ
ncbi:MAG: hypothetical protein ACKOCN_02960 [Planctomycetaceae bacterium]